MNPLSKRLQGVADLVPKGEIVADIGTDHGYIPVYLLKNGWCKKAFAMDVKEGPLSRATSHVRGHGLEDAITLRLSDGLKRLEKGEATCLVLAGMGGNLVVKILSEEEEVLHSMSYVILQPQSDIGKVRKYMEEQGFIATKEDMVFEEGKYYPMMRYEKGVEPPLAKEELLFGRGLLKEGHPVLRQFLDREIQKMERLYDRLQKTETKNALGRLESLQDEIEVLRRAREQMKGEKDEIH